MILRSLSVWPLAMLVAALSSLASAQQPPERTAPLPFQSGLEGYKRFADQPVAPWKPTNDEVGRIGGWKAYAKEAREPKDDASPPPPPPPAPHGGHQHGRH